MPTPFKHAYGKWAVQYGAKLSGTGRPKMIYYATLDAAKKEISKRQKERNEHGTAIVTSEDRTWIAFLKQELANYLSVLPDIISLWKAQEPAR